MAHLLSRLLGASRKGRRVRVGILLSLAVGAAYLIVVLLLDPLAGLQNAATDALFRRGAASENITIVAIQDSDLEQYGRLGEWPRALHATAVENLQQAGARVIVYDLLFVDEAEDTEVLAQAIAAAGNVVLAAAGSGSPEHSDGSLQLYETLTLPQRVLRDAAAGVAHVNLEVDDDGRVRRVPLAVESGAGDVFPAISLAAFYAQLEQTSPPAIDTEGGELRLIGRTVPLEDQSAMRINYTGGAGEFRTFGFADAIDGTFPEALVRNKAVFVGVIATGVDRHSAPLLGNASGIEIHANALDTLLRARFLRPAPGWLSVVTALALVVVAGVVVATWRVGFSIATVLALGVAYLGAGTYLFYQGWVLNLADPPSAALIAAGFGLAYRIGAERATRREIVDLFGRYVSPAVAGELMERADRDDLTLGGERRDVTVLFADIRGFTPLSQGRDPVEVVTLLNEHLDAVVGEILNHGGIVNKFLGDAVLAIWNAPRLQPDRAVMACRAALTAQAKLDKLFGKDSPIRFGYGINEGLVVVGNVGTAGRLEYTVIGEAVNVAARLCGAAAGGEIWVGEEVYDRARAEIEAERLPPQHLKGMTGPVTAYKLTGEASETRHQEGETAH